MSLPGVKNLEELSSASLRNWNDGIMERWNNGFGGLGKWFTRLNRVPSGKFNRVNWENQLDKEGNKYETSAKDIHSSSFQYARGARVPSGQKKPPFHYSMGEAKDNSLKKPLYF